LQFNPRHAAKIVNVGEWAYLQGGAAILADETVLFANAAEDNTIIKGDLIID
jgi:hypothetical protein